MNEIQKSVSETLTKVCSNFGDLFCATVWAFGVEKAVVLLKGEATGVVPLSAA